MLGRLLLFLTSIAVVVLALAFFVAFLTPDRQTDVFIPGLASQFQPGTVTHYPDKKLFLVRYLDGSFQVFYDLDPRMQGQQPSREAASGETPHLTCRLAWFPDGVGELTGDHPNFGRGVFREPCFDSTYNAAGERIFGPSPRNLDRFPLELRGEQLVITLSERHCDGQRCRAPHR